MELDILISKKGTHVVVASQLYAALELPSAQYSKMVRRWVQDVYDFQDGIRQPVIMADYAKRKVEHGVLEDFYLSIELARMVALHSGSKHKRKIALYLQHAHTPHTDAGRMTSEQVRSAMELSSVMGLVSCQVAAEQQHKHLFEQRFGEKPEQWWTYRATLLGYDRSQLESQYKALGKSANGKTIREMLIAIDRFELIRTAVIDWCMACGYSADLARNLGDVAKAFAAQFRTDVMDDRDMPLALLPKTNQQLAQAIRQGNIQAIEKVALGKAS